MQHILFSLRKVMLTLHLKTPHPHLGVRITQNIHVNIDPEKYGVQLNAEIVDISDTDMSINCAALQKQQSSLDDYRAEISFCYNNELYLFYTTIIGKNTKGLLKLTRPDKIHKQHQKDDIRHTCQIPVRITAIDGNDIPGFDIKEHILSTKDISAGGMCLQCAAYPLRGHTDPHITGTAINTNSSIEILFALPHTGMQLSVNASIKWIHRVGHTNHIGIKFEEIPQKYQNFIVQYIYNEQIYDHAKEHHIFH